LVRDADRQKMSKTKGNVLDPIEVIGQYGTDADAVYFGGDGGSGTDIAFSESRTAGYRNFANKIWNAARFMFMNVEPGGLGPAARRRQECPPHTSHGVAGSRLCRWRTVDSLRGLNRAAADVNASLQNYRFDEAATRIYDFFWGEFCDWYLELIKPRLNFEEARIRLRHGWRARIW